MFCTGESNFSLYLVKVNGIASAFAIIPGIICAYSIFIALRRVHVNLKQLMYIESFAYVLRPIIQTIETFYVCNNYRSSSINDKFYLSLRISRNFIVAINRSIWIDVGIERLIATVYVQNYEKAKQAKYLLWIFVPLSLVKSVIYTYCVEFIGSNYVVIYSLLMMTAILAVLMFWIIRLKNKQLRQISNLAGLTLTEKYQIVENLRSLDYLIPHANIESITNFITVIFGLLMSIFGDRRSAVAMYNLCLNFQVFLFALYWIRLNSQLRRLFRQFHSRVIRPTTDLTTNSEPKQKNYVQNVLGAKIQKFQTVEDHFHAMKSAWN